MSRFLYQQQPGRSSDEDRRVGKALRYPQPMWDDVRVPMSSFQQGGVRDPDWIAFLDDGSGSTGVYVYGFAPGAEEEVFFAMQLPHKYMQYTALRPHIHWAPTSTNTGTVRWGLEYSITSVNGTFGNTAILYAEDAADGTTNKHQVVGFGEIAGTDLRISAMLIGRLFRDATHANDTYTADAAALELDFHIQEDTMGSDREFVKE